MLAFKGLQEEGLIHLHNSAFMVGPMLRHGAQKAMAPQEGRVLADPTAPGGLSDGETFNEGLGIGLPALGFSQASQWRLGQGRAGPQALFTTVAPQSPAPAPRGELVWLCMTMGTSRAIR